MFIESFSKLLTADCLRQPSQLFLSLPLEDKVHLGARGDVAEFNEMLSCKAEGTRRVGDLSPRVLIRILIWKIFLSALKEHLFYLLNCVHG